MRILFEDNHLIAVNKPHGMPTQGDSSQDRDLLNWVKDDIKVRHNKPGNVFVGLLHRLDRPVGGVVLLLKQVRPLVGYPIKFVATPLRRCIGQWLRVCQSSQREVWCSGL
ncbi:MAG: hypothetical protein IPG80_03485 [Anaerolineales bacterium]|nr:hypothetical protein [Anaerolineales bacterium]